MPISLLQGVAIFTLRKKWSLTLPLLLALSLTPAWADRTGADAEKKYEQAAATAKKNAGIYYDEVFDASGEIRPHYRDVFPIYLKKSDSQLKLIRKGTLKDFQGDNALSALPRLMPQEEFDTVKAGVEQRGKTLLRFLKDHYSGEKKYLRDGVIPKEVIHQILERAKELEYDGKLNPDLIQFMYGPDIIRDADGVHRVLEDNTSFLGGQGDLPLARESLYKHMPELQEVFEKEKTTAPISFYEDLVARYKSQLKNPADKIVLFLDPPYADNEDSRLKKIWESVGVEWVTPNSAKEVIFKPDGVYLKARKGKAQPLEKVGYVVFNADFYSSGKNSVKSRLVNAIAEGKVLANNYPGTEFINDKEFNMYVEDLIRYYLDEEPILRNLPSERIYKLNKKGERVVDEKVIRKLEQNWDKYVVKVVDGRGGDGIWVGPKLKANERKKVLKQLRESTDREIIIQSYRHPSVLGNDIVDLRILSHVGYSGSGPHAEIYVPNMGWSRGVSIKGDGKVNLSAGSAHEVSFMVRESAKAANEAPIRVKSCREGYTHFGHPSLPAANP